MLGVLFLFRLFLQKLNGYEYRSVQSLFQKSYLRQAKWQSEHLGLCHDTQAALLRSKWNEASNSVFIVIQNAEYVPI